MSVFEESQPDEKLRIETVAGRIGVGASTIKRWVKAGHFPEPMRIGGGRTSKMEWWKSTVENWIAEKEGRA